MEPRQFEIRSSSNSFASYKNVCAVWMSFFQQDGAFTAPWPVSSAEGVLSEFFFHKVETVLLLPTVVTQAWVLSVEQCSFLRVNQ